MEQNGGKSREQQAASKGVTDVAVLIVGGENVQLVALTAEAGDDLVAAVSVQIPNCECVSVNHGVLKYVALPLLVSLGIDHDLVTVPRLDGGNEAALAEVSDLDFAAAALGTWPGISLRDFDWAVG